MDYTIYLHEEPDGGVAAVQTHKTSSFQEPYH